MIRSALLLVFLSTLCVDCKPPSIDQFYYPEGNCLTVRDLVADVDDSKLTASSSWDSNHGPERARIDTVQEGDLRGSWNALHDDTSQWIQVDLDQDKIIYGVQTRGRNSDTWYYWVSAFRLLFSDDGIDWIEYSDINDNEDFAANYDKDTKVTNSWFLNGKPPIKARFVRFRTMKWNGHICMRLAVIGCDL